MNYAAKGRLVKFAKFVLFLGVVSAVFQPGHAEDNDWYLDAGFQYSDFEGASEIFPATFDAELGALSGHIGYRLLSWVSVEGEFGFGIQGDEDIQTYDPNIDFLLPPPTFDVQQTYIAGLSARVQHGLGDHFLVFAKAGIAHTRFEFTQANFTLPNQPRTIEEFSETETGPSYGVGVEIYVNESSGIRADVTRYDFGETENTSLSLGYSYRF